MGKKIMNVEQQTHFSMATHASMHNIPIEVLKNVNFILSLDDEEEHWAWKAFNRQQEKVSKTTKIVGFYFHREKCKKKKVKNSQSHISQKSAKGGKCGGGEGGGRDQGGAQDTPSIFIVRGARMEAWVAINWWVGASEREATKTCTFSLKILDVFGRKGKLSEHIYINCRIYIQFLIRLVWRKYSDICFKCFK